MGFKYLQVRPHLSLAAKASVQSSVDRGAGPADRPSTACTLTQITFLIPQVHCSGDTVHTSQITLPRDAPHPTSICSEASPDAPKPTSNTKRKGEYSVGYCNADGLRDRRRRVGCGMFPLR